MSEELRLLFLSREIGKWRPLGDDGNGFDRSSEGREAAWREAQAAANLGLPWAGATYRLVDVFEGEHADDCVLGLDADAWCDCGVPPAIVEERVLLPEVMVEGDRVLTEEESAAHGLGRRVRELTLRTRVVTDRAELDRLGLGGLVVEGVVEPGPGVCSQCSPGHRGADGLCQRHGKVIA